MREMFRIDEMVKLNMKEASSLSGQMNAALMKCLKLVVLIGLPVSVAGFLTGVLASFMQVGSIFTFEPIAPKIEKIDPLKGLMRFFSMRFVLDAIRTILKSVIGLWVAYALVKSEIFTSPQQMLMDPARFLSSISSTSKTIFLTLVGVFTIFAGMDWWLQRKEWLKQVRLTRQEAKEEAKEREGNPQVKARIRSIQREMSRKRMMAAVKKADVIVTNPTHIAIAIQYDKDKMMAPRVVAKGADFVAQKIKAIAAEAGVPTVENVPLARTLYKSVKVNQYIPRALYQAVAEVLAYVYRLRHRR
jgi:flagellar biosynthetic protein FlhB